MDPNQIPPPNQLQPTANNNLNIKLENPLTTPPNQSPPGTMLPPGPMPNAPMAVPANPSNQGLLVESPTMSTPPPPNSLNFNNLNSNLITDLPTTSANNSDLTKLINTPTSDGLAFPPVSLPNLAGGPNLGGGGPPGIGGPMPNGVGGLGDPPIRPPLGMPPFGPGPPFPMPGGPFPGG